MSRRIWLGGAKGQFTTYPTYFPTTRSTSYQVQTSAVTSYSTVYPTTFDTVFLTPKTTTFPTDYTTNTPVPTIYAVPTPYITSDYYPLGTLYSNPTTYISLVPTDYSRNTTTSYTYPVITVFSVSTGYPQSTTFVTCDPYQVNTTYTSAIIENTSNVTSYTTPGAFENTTICDTVTTNTEVGPASGSVYYDENGNETGQSGFIGCSASGCTITAEYSTTVAVSFSTTFDTFVPTSRNTSGPTTYISLRNTCAQVPFSGQEDPIAGIPCTPNGDLAMEQWCIQEGNNCQPCTGTYQSCYNTGVPYEVVTSGITYYDSYFPTSRQTSGTTTYVHTRDFSCSSVICPTSYQSCRVSQYYVPAHVTSRTTTYPTVIGYTNYPVPTTYPNCFNTTQALPTVFQPTDYSVETQYPTSQSTVTAWSTPTEYPYQAITEYTVQTLYLTTFSTDYITDTPIATDYITNTPVPTSRITDASTQHPTSQATSNVTNRTTFFDTTYTNNTTVTTSRSTTWFTE